MFQAILPVEKVSTDISTSFSASKNCLHHIFINKYILIRFFGENIALKKMRCLIFFSQNENGDPSRQGILKRSNSMYGVQSNSMSPSSADELKMSKAKVRVRNV